MPRPDVLIFQLLHAENVLMYILRSQSIVHV